MIVSKPFGPTILTGEDVRKFQEQVASGKPNPRAQESLKRGRDLLRIMESARPHSHTEG